MITLAVIVAVACAELIRQYRSGVFLTPEERLSRDLRRRLR